MNEDSINLFDDDWDKEEREEIKPSYDSLVVYSRDWTIDTIYNQIQLNNIDLNPKFQRRNAWKDEKRSRLIESLILSVPVPEIVLAEDKDHKKKFIVIDGKQRLLTIAGFINPKYFEYWDNNKIRKLTSLPKLNGVDYEELKNNPKYESELRQFLNADLRCTVISNYDETDILYDIFYRLNTGSVPLSPQELRQVLNKGPFANYLIEITNTLQPIHMVMNRDSPDPRLIDIEIILRFFSFDLFGKEYKGNLKVFLDNSMKKINEEWSKYKHEVENLYESFNNGIEILDLVLGKDKGRRFNKGKWEKRFNKVLFETQVYYFRLLKKNEITATRKKKFISEFKKLMTENETFNDSITSSTKAIYNYQNRYQLFRKLFNKSFSKRINLIPTKE